MKAFIDFVANWAGAISACFKEYTLAAGLLTLVAIAVAYFAWQKYSPKTWIGRCFLFLCVLLGWLALVPIFGAMMKATGFVFSFFLHVYEKFEDQPLFVASCTILVPIAAAIWMGILWIRKKPRKLAQMITILLLVWLFLIFIGVPLVNQFYPPKEKTKRAAVAVRTEGIGTS